MRYRQTVIDGQGENPEDRLLPHINRFPVNYQHSHNFYQEVFNVNKKGCRFSLTEVFFATTNQHQV